MRIATAAPAADDGDDEFPPRRRETPAVNREHEVRHLLLRLGKVRFGSPLPDVPARLHDLTLAEMEPLVDSLLTATNWDELLNSV